MTIIEPGAVDGQDANESSMSLLRYLPPGKRELMEMILPMMLRNFVIEHFSDVLTSWRSARSLSFLSSGTVPMVDGPKCLSS